MVSINAVDHGLQGDDLKMSKWATFLTYKPKNLKKIIPVKVFQQECEDSCAGAVVKMLLNHFRGVQKDESMLNEKLQTGKNASSQGTYPDKLISILKEEGFVVEFGENAEMPLVYHYIDQNIPVIVLDSTWGGHWRLVVGYDFQKDYLKWETNDVFIADPELRSMEPIIDRESGLTVENERRFYFEWFENLSFERLRRRFYIVAWPKEMSIEIYKSQHTKD